MKSLTFNRKSLLFSILLVSVLNLNAQIESTHIDAKFGYTTVVYKDKAATDTDVLSALDKSIGMGDVVRVTVAPPKAVALPAADKSKGEDLWLKSAKVNPNLSASTSAAPTAVAKVKAPVAAPKVNAPVASVAKAPVAAKPVVKSVAAASKPAVAPAQNLEEEKVAAAPKTAKAKTSKTSKSSNKSLKKSGKKSGTSFKKKNRKAGKQRYGCPKF